MCAVFAIAINRKGRASGRLATSLDAAEPSEIPKLYDMNGPSRHVKQQNTPFILPEDIHEPTVSGVL